MTTYKAQDASNPITLRIFQKVLVYPKLTDLKIIDLFKQNCQWLIIQACAPNKRYRACFNFISLMIYRTVYQ